MSALADRYRSVLVTGASSEIMRAMLSSPSFDGVRVVGLTRSAGGPSGQGNLEWVQGELEQPESYRESLRDIDLVIHAAAVTHARDPEDYYRVNQVGTSQLVDAAQQQGVERFMLVSSRAAVPGSGAYGESKLAAEEIVRARYNDHLIARPSEVFGVGRNEGIEKLISDAIKGGVHLYPAGVPSGLCPIHVSDVASDMLGLLQTAQPDQRTVELVGETTWDYAALIRAIGRWTGRRQWLVPVPRLALQTATRLIATSGLALGPVPDQVSRLYAPKRPVAPRTSPVQMPLEQYVRSLAAG